ncbi:hypothetical protein JCM30566_17480 [Marinitoga arctica]
MKKVVVYVILLMMFVNMIPVNIFADLKVVNVKVLTDDEMENIIGAGSNNGGGNSGGSSTRTEKQIIVKEITYKKYFNYIEKGKRISDWQAGGTIGGNISVTKNYSITLHGSLSVGAETSVVNFIKNNLSVNTGKSASASFSTSHSLYVKPYLLGAIFVLHHFKNEEGEVHIRYYCKKYENNQVVRTWKEDRYKTYNAYEPIKAFLKVLYEPDPTSSIHPKIESHEDARISVWQEPWK